MSPEPPQRASSPRLDLLSPLPPVRSGIADYVVDLLPELDRVCDLRVVRVPGQPVLETLSERWAPVEVSRLGEDGRMPFYQMGNNEYHAAICDHASRRPGLLTLHDPFLHHLLLERTLGRADLEGYVSALVTDHGWLGGAIALPPRWSAYGQAGLFTLPAHRALLERQRGILVHSRWAEQLLHDEEITRPVATVPMPMPLPPADRVSSEPARALRARHGIPASAFVVGSFGFQTPIKRTSTVIRALAGAGLEEVHLLVGGQLSPQLDYDSLACELGLAARVHVTGYLPAEDLLPAIAACDLVANLRYPTAGETSASLLRVLACGRGALVSDYAQFGELPDEVAIKIPLVGEPDDGGEGGGEDSAEEEALAAVLRRLQKDPNRVRDLGESARRWVQRHHRPRAAAERIAEVASGWSELPLPSAIPKVAEAPHPSSLTWGPLSHRITVRGVEGWRAGERRRVEVELRNRGFARLLPAERGPGGVAVQVRLLAPDGAALESAPWLPLRRTVEPGQAAFFELELRRPLGPCRLRAQLRVFGDAGIGALKERSSWEEAV